MNVIFSVVVCTHNRSDMLEGCLDSLRQQTLDKSRYEVIVVDNNSSDDTRQVVEGFLSQGNIRYVLETHLGLCHARNRGWKETLGEYVAYIDDDARAAKDWLEVADNVVNTLRPELDCLGGPYHPFYTSSKPAWFLDKYEIRGFRDAPKYLKQSEYISGSNMIWSKNALDMVGGFNDAIGIVGNTLKLGDETDAFNTLWSTKEKSKLYFSPDLIVYHWVPEFKMKVSYRLKRKFAEGQYQGGQEKPAGFSGRIGILVKWVFLLFKASLRFLFRFNSHPYWQNWIVEDGARVAFYFGRVLRVMGIQPVLSRVD